MKKIAAFVAAVAMMGSVIAPAQAAGVFRDALLKDTTMLGWQRTSQPAAVAYFKMPLQADKHGAAQPRAGLMISAPKSYAAGTAVLRQSGAGMIDLGFSGRDLSTPWTASLMVSNQVAWTANPEAMPKNTKYLFESGASWVVVGLVSVGIIAGVYVLADRDN
jgi:hypothetical protein